ncbi:MAG: 3-phosphoglycerate dehydrogenase [Bacteroidales bacterium]|nr:3-phosphoglycerate dehydrogenase [Bacteroidales bacterium]
MKVLLATQKPFAAKAVEGIEAILKDSGHEVVKLEKYEAQADLVAAVADVEAMIIRSDKVTAEVIAAAPKLKIVVRAGAGFDNVDLEAATAAKVVVMNTPGQNSNAVAELALGLMIFMARTQFTPATGSELQGKRLGVQAYGNVGRLVGQKAKALGMEISALDPFLTDDQIIAGGAQPVHSVEELYAASDYLSIHIPALPATIKSIGYDLITRMPKGATLVNTARKEVIDEEGLEKALEERPDLKYVKDIMPDNYAVLQEKFGLRVFATPKKMGAQTAEANVNAGLAAARQIADFFATGNCKFQVNKKW